MSKTLTQHQLQACIDALEEHIRAENMHDLDAIMRTFGDSSILVLNGSPFDDHARIRALHQELGFGEGGGFSDLQVIEKQRYISDNAIIMEQTLSGKHTGTWRGFEPTGRSFEIPVCTIYSFDSEARIAGER